MSNVQYIQDTQEKIKQLPIDGVSVSIVYSVPVSLKKGQLVYLTAEFEASNPYSYNAMISSSVIVGTTKTATKGTVVDPANAFNITPSMHHGVVVKARQWLVDKDYENAYISLVAYSGAEAAKKGDALTIEQGYGHLDVVIAG